MKERINSITGNDVIQFIEKNNLENKIIAKCSNRAILFKNNKCLVIFNGTLRLFTYTYDEFGKLLIN